MIRSFLARYVVEVDKERLESAEMVEVKRMRTPFFFGINLVFFDLFLRSFEGRLDNGWADIVHE